MLHIQYGKNDNRAKTKVQSGLVMMSFCIIFVCYVRDKGRATEKVSDFCGQRDIVNDD